MTAIDPYTVRQLIKDRGASVTFRRVTEGAYDPSTGATGSPTTDDETVRAAFVNYSQREVDGTNIQRGDRRALMSNYDVVGDVLSKSPRTDDKLVGESSTVTVIDTITLKDAGTVIGYILQVRE